jgi:hypothetical protein
MGVNGGIIQLVTEKRTNKIYREINKISDEMAGRKLKESLEKIF